MPGIGMMMVAAGREYNADDKYMYIFADEGIAMSALDFILLRHSC